MNRAENSLQLTAFRPRLACRLACTLQQLRFQFLRSVTRPSAVCLSLLNNQWINSCFNAFFFTPQMYNSVTVRLQESHRKPT